MVQCSGKAGNVCDDTSTDDEDWLISGNTVVLHVNKNVLNILDVLVDLIAVMDQLDERNIVGVEVVLQFFAKELLNLVIDDSNTSSKWFVHFGKDFVRCVQDTSGDLDRGSDVGAHHSLNGLGVRGGHRDSIAVTVDAGWVDRVGIDLLKSKIIGKVLLGIVKCLRLHVVFDSEVS